MKTLLLALLLLLVFLAACQPSLTDSPIPNATAPPPDSTSSEIERALLAINPFIVKDGETFYVDHARAQAAGRTIDEINIGDETAALATDILAGVQIDDYRFAPFEVFFHQVSERAEVGSMHGDGYAHEKGDTGPQLTHCPPVSGLSTPDPAGYLTSRGYHLVPGYASLNYGHDYAKFISTSHWPASFWPYWTYRAQALVGMDGVGTIRFQSPEPNPELLAYPWWQWPGTWWSAYVAYWHRYYC